MDIKRTYFFIVFLFVSLPLFSQDYYPRESWPYLYNEFQKGCTYSFDGKLISEEYMNIAIHDGSLHYIGKDDVIMKADMTRLARVTVGDNTYMNISGYLYKILYEKDKDAVLLKTEINIDELDKVSIGYGINSSTASAQGIAILMDGRFDTMGKNLLQTEDGKNDGKELPVRTQYYILHNGNLILAKKQEIMNLPGIDKQKAKLFFKNEKIKWKNVESLSKVISFLNTCI